ncbi:alpha/beta fold hydrolase [Streptomyces hokutonensis]|uniref:alpha/beta fold hydrolase n=1 Tax=Streptomyces hokutonensis TaxID=1306990 RepID=UPI0036CB9CDE
MPFWFANRALCGPADGRPLVLLPGGGGATSASWYARAADLARAGHRVHAVDLIGFPGPGIPAPGRRPRTPADLMTWLDAVFDGLGVTSAADLSGHSCGGWIALHHALHAPDRIRRLFLLDPTQCFAGFETAYLLHALPMLLRPTPRRVPAFLEWETGGAALDPDWRRRTRCAGSTRRSCCFWPEAAGPVTRTWWRPGRRVCCRTWRPTSWRTSPSPTLGFVRAGGPHRAAARRA